MYLQINMVLVFLPREKIGKEIDEPSLNTHIK